jgi:hypothetical protein
MGIYSKWPRLIVVGEPVSEQRADEILVRTTDWNNLFSNDRAWKRMVLDVLSKFGHPGDAWDHDAAQQERMRRVSDGFAWNERHGILSLQYLDNDRVMSAWVGGPKGWCDWDGSIGCSNYNIGKWPSDEDVTEDWTSIAEAFPWLTLDAQCLNEEGEGGVAGLWHVEGGRVTYTEGACELLMVPNQELSFRGMMPGGERGIYLERLESALARVLG